MHISYFIFHSSAEGDEWPPHRPHQKKYLTCENFLDANQVFLKCMWRNRIFFPCRLHQTKRITSWKASLFFFFFSNSTLCKFLLQTAVPFIFKITKMLILNIFFRNSVSSRLCLPETFLFTKTVVESQGLEVSERLLFVPTFQLYRSMVQLIVFKIRLISTKSIFVFCPNKVQAVKFKFEPRVWIAISNLFSIVLWFNIALRRWSNG